MARKSALAVILAAGDGTRMRSATPKVLHEIASRPLVGHVLAATAAAGIDRRAVVVGAGAERVTDYVAKADPKAAVHVQKERLGTAHAVLAARKSLADTADQVIVLYGDTPLITTATLRRLRAKLAAGADVVVLGFRPADPTGYGRLLVDGRRLTAIREHADATAEERAIGLCNAGIMGFAGKALMPLLKKIGNDNAKGEYYLTDAVEIANARGLKVVALEVDADDVLGVNSRVELAEAEAVFQRRARLAAMTAGVTMTAPETVWLSHDTVLGRDVTIEPNVVFGPGVTVGEGATIFANSHIVGATIAAGATIGPFARLRPGAAIAEGGKVGNFVEIKNADIGPGAKVPHLTYVGDATIGAKANIGAGTITCNYDGFGKYRTEIGEGAFIGSNSSLVAPVSIGAGAIVGSGSVITTNVPPDALAVGRGRQETKPDWARKFREKRAGAKRGK